MCYKDDDDNDDEADADGGEAMEQRSRGYQRQLKSRIKFP